MNNFATIKYRVNAYRRLSDGMGIVETPQRWRLSICWLPLLVCGGLIFIADVFQVQQYYTTIITKLQYDSNNNKQEMIIIDEQQSLKGFLIKTTGCRIPFMDPFDKSVKQFIKHEQTINCNKNEAPAIIESNFTSIFINNASLIYYNIDVETINCCYQPFYRKEPRRNENDNKVRFNGTCYNFTNSQTINDEFIKVICKWDNQTYIDFFAFVPLKDVSKPFKQNHDEEAPLNVLVIGIDGVSRLNFHRQMPKTVDYLKQNLSSIELYGYNKVADNTYPNLIPVLTGLTEHEMTAVCYNKMKHFDDCPLIWKNYKNHSYITAFGEDASWMGLFNYQRCGFYKQPTDYMWGVFNRYVESIIGKRQHGNVKHCIGTREVYRVFLDYIKRFVYKMVDLPYFGFFWGASLTHDYLNTPQLGDETYLEFFQYLHDNNHLNRTILIVMSDHGLRFGPIRETYQGRMEERLPFVFFVLPDWYKRQYHNAYKNLIKNQRRLTTPFDLHETLKDLLLNPHNLAKTTTMQQRGYTLFQEIDTSRTCKDAGISVHWCTCLQSTEIDINSTEIVDGANFIVNYINNQLIGYKQCANLQLNQILNARKMTHGEHLRLNEQIDDYMITITTVPGNGIFETTIRKSTNNNKTYHYEIMGTISRLNLYGEQSACITDFHLKLYCYCTSIF